MCVCKICRKIIKLWMPSPILCCLQAGNPVTAFNPNLKVWKTRASGIGSSSLRLKSEDWGGVLIIKVPEPEGPGTRRSIWRHEVIKALEEKESSPSLWLYSQLNDRLPCCQGRFFFMLTSSKTLSRVHAPVMFYLVLGKMDSPVGRQQGPRVGQESLQLFPAWKMEPAKCSHIPYLLVAFLVSWCK